MRSATRILSFKAPLVLPTSGQCCELLSLLFVALNYHLDSSFIGDAFNLAFTPEDLLTNEIVFKKVSTVPIH